MLATRLNLLSACSRITLNKITSRTYLKKPFFYDDRYMGGFDYHDRERYPRRLNPFKEEELLKEVHDIRNLKIDKPSPFHVVRRIKSMTGLPWTQKVTLRRLNLHSSYNGDCVIVPNTPQFNSLLAKVKHLIELKPAIFTNGTIPTDDDIGAIKVCPYTGRISVDEKLRSLEERVNIEKPLLFQGNHLRAKINKLTGLSTNHYLR